MISVKSAEMGRNMRLSFTYWKHAPHYVKGTLLNIDIGSLGRLVGSSKWLQDEIQVIDECCGITMNPIKPKCVQPNSLGDGHLFLPR